MKTRSALLSTVAGIGLLLMGCSSTVDETGGVEPSEVDLENLVRRSYQYVAMYNTNNNFAMDPNNPFSTGGWNRSYVPEGLVDHTFAAVPRPNSDTLYFISMLDLRHDAVVIEYPAFDSKFVSLETSAYDHYVDIPLATSKGDFTEPTTMLFYTEPAAGYSGEPVDGVDRILEMSGDFAIAFLRIMPHANEPERFARNMAAMNSVTVQTLSEFQGNPAKPVDDVTFPAFGRDADVFANNFLEVMQFAFNHTTFDPDDEMDQGALDALRPFGVEPGQAYDPTRGTALDGQALAETAERIAQESLATWSSPSGNPYLRDVFKPKGEMTLDPMVVQSAVGPIGQPADQAMYPGIGTSDGEPLNALNDYVIRMTEDELPPANAFWSLTLYDAQNGLFIPNDRKKYSVGENAGMLLNDSGGIDMYVAAEQPDGVPEENWLPIQREDLNLDLIMRIYVPDEERMSAWEAPRAEKLGSQ